MPTPPAWLKGVNGIVFLISNPCDAPWVVYWETAFPPAGKAVIRLVTFGMLDLMRAIFRPKGLRSGRHGRRGRRGGRKPFRIPDTPELIAKRLPGQQALAERQVSTGVKNLWIIDGVIQRFLWYWLVFDVVSDFFYDWASLIMETRFCQAKDQPRALWMDQIAGIAAISGWVGFNGGELKYNHDIAGIGASAIALDAGRYLVAGSALIKNTGNDTQDQSLQLIEIGQAQPENDVATATAVDPGGDSELAVSIVVEGPTDIEFETKVSLGFGEAEKGSLFVISLKK